MKKNADASRTRGMCQMIYIFLNLLKVRYNCAKFHHCGICVTYVRQGDEFLYHPWTSPFLEQSQKDPYWMENFILCAVKKVHLTCVNVGGGTIISTQLQTSL